MFGPLNRFATLECVSASASLPRSHSTVRTRSFRVKSIETGKEKVIASSIVGYTARRDRRDISNLSAARQFGELKGLPEKINQMQF